jgi:glycosyltransferase involved in cell wall biosynthesis
MKQLQRLAFLGNHLPPRCGIATFTQDLHREVSKTRSDLETCVVAMTDHGRAYDYPPAVRFQVRDDTIDDYVQAAAFLNQAGVEVVSLQHEYGIFGGEAGSHINELLSRLEMPVVTTLHTVLPEPSVAQRDMMHRIIDRSTKIIVMAEKGRELLRSVHGVAARKIEVIPHGIPDFPFLDSLHAKAQLGFAGKTIVLTFGLLSPSKGIESVIDAMPRIIERCPSALYVVLGATHPNLVRHQGEAYRDTLTARVRELGIEEHVVFFDQFVDQATLLDFISMCDVYVTPYLNEAQMTSGTLAYSFGLGKAVVSTPYWHAKELLSDGRGILVPFGDARALSTEIAGLLTNDVQRHSMRKRAYTASRSMTWAQTARRYLTLFEAERANGAPGISIPGTIVVSKSKRHAVPAMQVGHFLSLCDSTGILQHAVHCVPDRAHGYCVDDNARALQDRAYGCRRILVSSGLGLHAPRVRRLLLARQRRSPGKPYAKAACGQVDVHIFRGESQRVGLVRRRARIRQFPSSPGVDPDGLGDQDTGVRRCRSPLAPLALVNSDDVIRIL